MLTLHVYLQPHTRANDILFTTVNLIRSAHAQNFSITASFGVLHCDVDIFVMRYRFTMGDDIF